MFQVFPSSSLLKIQFIELKFEFLKIEVLRWNTLYFKYIIRLSTNGGNILDYFQGYDQLFLKRQGQAGGAASTSADSCDGHDELGCYQVKEKTFVTFRDKYSDPSINSPFQNCQKSSFG